MGSAPVSSPGSRPCSCQARDRSVALLCLYICVPALSPCVPLPAKHCHLAAASWACHVRHPGAAALLLQPRERERGGFVSLLGSGMGEESPGGLCLAWPLLPEAEVLSLSCWMAPALDPRLTAGVAVLCLVAGCSRLCPGCPPAPGSVPCPPTLPGSCRYLLGHKTFGSVSRVCVLVGEKPPPRLRWPGALLCQREMMRSDQACPCCRQRCLSPPDQQTGPGKARPMLQVCPKPTSPGKAAAASPPPAKQLPEGKPFSPPLKGSHSRPCSSRLPANQKGNSSAEKNQASVLALDPVRRPSVKI